MNSFEIDQISTKIESIFANARHSEINSDKAITICEKVKELGGFAAQIAETTYKTLRCSGKQAYWMAKAIVEAGLNLTTLMELEHVPTDEEKAEEERLLESIDEERYNVDPTVESAEEVANASSYMAASRATGGKVFHNFKDAVNFLKNAGDSWHIYAGSKIAMTKWHGVVNFGKLTREDFINLLNMPA